MCLDILKKKHCTIKESGNDFESIDINYLLHTFENIIFIENNELSSYLNLFEFTDSIIRTCT